MKNKLIILLLTLTSFYVHAESRPFNKIQDKIECDFQNIKGIETLEILTSTKAVVGHDRVGYPIYKVDFKGSVRLTFKNGEVELLSPKAGTGGTFDQVRFPSTIVRNTSAQRNTTVLVRSARVGNIKISYNCNKPHSKYCDGMFDGPEAPNANLIANINGLVIKSNGSELPLCKRTVLR